MALYGWQQNVIDCIEKHTEQRESEQYQGLSDYSVNRSLGLTVAYPRKSGHTYLVNYIASLYPCVLVYNKMSDYMDLIKNFPLHNNTDTLSTFEIYYALHKPDLRTPSPDYLDLRARFQNKKVVICDQGLSVPVEVRDFLFDVSQGIVIFLGH